MALNHLSLLRPLLCQSLVRQVRSPLVATSRVRAPLLCPDTTCYPAACARLYATKKAKAKAKGQSSKVNINSALVEDIISLDEVKGDMTAVLNALKDDFTRNLSIRTSPGALDHIVVTTQDGKFPLNQLGQVSMKSPQLIMVNMSSFPEDECVFMLKHPTTLFMKCFLQDFLNTHARTLAHIPLRSPLCFEPCRQAFDVELQCNFSSSSTY
ncbi:ribosome-recycling factor, mitochondrial isoform X2 [Perca flavescens]|uniref:ribosome-recycling factor, mitochondrial isoform X2 n=1 Tax=Perca flavescens TaxID=8167 RepID=UPI00106F04BC|nr:ribosome-recycling factor, mitochondrial isoform X2 [Perca flavescens]